MDDSTFECRNVGIYDSIISATLIPKKIERKIMLNKQSLIRKNEVYLKINLSCTDKNNQIYLKPKNIMDLESYMTQKDLNLQKGDLLLKIMQTISILFAAAVLAALIVIINAFS
jgi:ABC-type phosphate/phosphonate transport system permease subunit